MSTTATDLTALALFEGCSLDDLANVADAVTGERRAVEGEVICAEGEDAERWWIVVDGMADVTAAGLYVGTIGPGETIGEMALLDGEPRGATVTAATGMVLHEVNGDAFVGALLESPRLSLALLRQVAARLRTANLARPRSTARPAAVPRAATSPSPVVAATELDPRAPGYFEDPHAQLDALCEIAPVHWSEAMGSYVVCRYEDVHRLSRDRSLLGSITTTEAVSSGPPLRSDKMMIRRDGEDHMRQRRLVSKVFTPRAIATWAEHTELIVERLLDAAALKGEIDVIAEYALPLPAQIISEMLGMPKGDVPQLREWSRTLTKGLDPFVTADEQEAADLAGRAIGEYVDEVVADKRSAHADDILTDLIRARDEGDALDTDEVVLMVILLYIAGHETTVNLIGNGLTHLFHNPDQFDRLRTDPGLDANAMEEVLRFEGPAHFTRRVTRQPIEVGGVTIPADSLLTLALAAANRDPRKWGPTAGVLDVARERANEHVSFGGGPHFCLGASLARMEGQSALPRLVRRFPRMQPAYDAPAWSRRMFLRGVDRLPVSLRA